MEIKKKNALYITELRNCPKNYLRSPKREEYFEILWINNEKTMYLIPPFRAYRLNKFDEKGVLIAFNLTMLNYNLNEFSLDVFKLFNREGEFSTVNVNQEAMEILQGIYEVLLKEYHKEDQHFLLLATLLKGFLLKLIQSNEQEFTHPDLNEKRIYQFFLILEGHYDTEKGVDFYAEKLNITAKRLNQILKQKLNKTINQIIQERLIIEAKHEIYIGKLSVKEIANKLGFEEHSYFSRFFKKMTGETPQGFKKTIKEEIFNH
ncbi:helix-turn-helix domain-containing protein [Pedobacter immunditicola]|uniref:helix-turn-helix domain-containing protein n=1 Tax=Pedobacter immunditicola TaxID=3133440 RepID=UPI0030A594A2